MSAQCVTGAEHEMSRTSEVAPEEVKVWKKPKEFSRSIETAWQSVTVELERKLEKKVLQLGVAKLLDTMSNGCGIGIDVPEEEVDARRCTA